MYNTRYLHSLCRDNNNHTVSNKHIHQFQVLRFPNFLWTMTYCVQKPRWYYTFTISCYMAVRAAHMYVCIPVVSVCIIVASGRTKFDLTRSACSIFTKRISEEAKNVTAPYWEAKQVLRAAYRRAVCPLGYACMQFVLSRSSNKNGRKKIRRLLAWTFLLSI